MLSLPWIVRATKRSDSNEHTATDSTTSDPEQGRIQSCISLVIACFSSPSVWSTFSGHQRTLLLQQCRFYQHEQCITGVLFRACRTSLVLRRVSQASSRISSMPAVSRILPVDDTRRSSSRRVSERPFAVYQPLLDKQSTCKPCTRRSLATGAGRKSTIDNCG